MVLKPFVLGGGDIAVAMVLIGNEGRQHAFFMKTGPLCLSFIHSIDSVVRVTWK